MRRKKVLGFICIVFLLLITSINAQEQSPPGPPVAAASGMSAMGPPPPPGVPIDTGLPILFLVGVLFGVYIIYQSQHKTIKKPL